MFFYFFKWFLNVFIINLSLNEKSLFLIIPVTRRVKAIPVTRRVKGYTRRNIQITLKV